jgi:hypothetical protein
VGLYQEDLLRQLGVLGFSLPCFLPSPYVFIIAPFSGYVNTFLVVFSDFVSIWISRYQPFKRQVIFISFIEAEHLQAPL